jgi:hypothetical protein
MTAYTLDAPVTEAAATAHGPGTAAPLPDPTQVPSDSTNT